MKAPDKIYIPIIEEEGKKLLCTNWWETDTSSRNAYVNETIPYIRKDTLLEWAKNELESARQTDFDEFGRGEVITLESIIKKLNSL